MGKRSWNQSSSIQITLSRYEGSSLIDGPTKLRKEWIVEGGIRLSIREVLCVSYQESRSMFDEIFNMCWMPPT